MSLLEVYRKCFSNHTAVHRTDSTKLVVEDDVVDGVLVQKTLFKSVNLADDARQKLDYHDLSLANLKRLGVTSQLRNVMLQRNDVDIVINEIENLQKSSSNGQSNSQVPSPSNQA